MRKKVITVFVSFLFIYGCGSSSFKQSCEEKGLDYDCCPEIDSTKIPLPTPSIENINVFLETSGSMQGYMPKSNVATNFQVLISDILAKLQGKYSGKVHFYSIVDTHTAFSKLDLTQARNKILRGDFTWGGSTYIPSMLDSIINRYLGNESVSLFISDCIYSPENSEQIIKSLTTTDIRSIIEPHSSKYSTTVFCCFSEYRKTQSQTSESPYYLIVQGQPLHIHEIEGLVYESIKDKEQQYKELNLGLHYIPPFYSVLQYTETSGNFEALSCKAFQNAFVSLQEIEIDGDQKQTTFWIGLDLSTYPKYVNEISYIKDNIKIALNNNEVEIVKFQKLPYPNVAKDDREIAAKCTHLIQLKIKELSDNVSILSMSLKCTLPDWGTTLNEVADENNREKTYGLGKIISGFEQAYCQNGTEYFFENLKISLIKKQ